MDEASSYIHKEQHCRNALKKIEFYRHNISSEDKEELLKVLDSIFLTTGDITKLFEEKFAQYINSNFAVGVMSCTHALELALRYFDIGPGDEVITTPMSFVATANVIEYVGAKPVFVDVEKTTGNINANLIEKAITSKTKAIIPVHLYGQMCDMLSIRKIADKHGLKVIEDSAHCVEGVRDNIRPGNLGDAACFSFYATKNLTCGEGGAITCNDIKMYEWLLQARQHGITSDAASRYTKKYVSYDVNFLGIKCNMSNIQAALMLHQIDRLDSLHNKRAEIVNLYDKALNDFSNLTILKVLSNVKHAYHLYTILVNASKRQNLLHALQEDGVGVAVNYTPIHLMTYYKNKYGYSIGDFPEAECIGASTISLPLYPKLNREEIDFVIDKLSKVVF